MFDEPLGALDRTLREDLLNELRTILQQTDIPAIYVTHDQEEAFTIADRLLILHDGTILRAGAPQEIWANPGSAFVANFLGLGNVLEGTRTGDSTVETQLGRFIVHCVHKHELGDKVHLLVRPLESAEGTNTISGVIQDVIFQKERFKAIFDNGLYMYFDTPPKEGERTSLKVKVECLG